MTRTKFIIILIATAILGVVAKVGHFEYMSAKVQRLEPIMVQEALKLGQDPETIKLFIPEPLKFRSELTYGGGFSQDPFSNSAELAREISERFTYISQGETTEKSFVFNFQSSFGHPEKYRYYTTVLSICEDKLCPYDPRSTREIFGKEFNRLLSDKMAEFVRNETITIPMPGDSDNIFSLQAMFRRNSSGQISWIRYTLRRENYTFEEMLDQWIKQYLNPLPDEISLYQYEEIGALYLPKGIMIWQAYD